MPTGDTRVELALKRFLSQNRLSSNFMDYLRTEYLDLGARIFPASGLFTYPVTITPNWGTSKFTLTPVVIEGIDNAGHVLQLKDVDHRVNIKFDNTVGIHNWIGFRYIEVVSGVYANPRSGRPEYDLNMNEVGEKDAPDSVTDNGDGTITFVVNTVTQSGYSHASRNVMVWLKNPVTIDATVAIETRTVSYAAPDNSITTTGALGQSVISVDPNDYYVACIGPTVHCQAAAAPMPFGDEYIVLGYIVGGAPGSTSTVDQVDLSGGGGHTLQKAYDGLAGSGSGRTVSVQDQAIQLRQENTTYRDVDIMNSALRIRKDIPTTLHNLGFLDEGGIDIPMRFESAFSLITRVSIHDMTGNDELRVEEVVSITDVDEITFTRVGVDLNLGSSTYSSLQVGDIIEIGGSAIGQDGVFTIISVDAGGSLLNVVEYNSPDAPIFINEAGLTARIYRPLLSLARNSHAVSIRSVSDFYREFNAGAAMPSGQIGIIMPDNTHDDEHVIKIDRDTEYFHVTACGDVEISGKLNILAGMTDGIEMNGRSLDMGGGHITAALTITATSDIRAEDDVYADHDGSGAGNFKYGAAKSYILYINPEDFGGHRYTAGFPSSDWAISSGLLDGEGLEYSQLVSMLPAGSGACYVSTSIHLPVGATITKIEALIQQDAGSQISMELEEQNHDWATPALVDRVKKAGPYLNATGGGVKVIDSGAITVTTVNGRGYILVFKGVKETLYIYGAKVTYTLSTIAGIG